MTRRFIAAALAVLLAFLANPRPAAAQQSDSGSIRIVVDDDADKTPLELARVLLDGPVITSEITEQERQSLFHRRPGWHLSRAHRQTRLPNDHLELVRSAQRPAVTVTVALRRSRRSSKSSATVRAKSSATVSSNIIDADSPQRKLSSDLADALNKLSGVAFQTTSDDSDATQTISLEGHDASQTQLTLDGIPLNAPGRAGNLRGFRDRSLSGCSVAMGPQLGGIGGGVNFSTLQPTLSWMSQTVALGREQRHGGTIRWRRRDRSTSWASRCRRRVSGSIRAWSTAEVYLDASGLEYDHDGDCGISGNVDQGAVPVRRFADAQRTFLNSARHDRHRLLAL